VIADEFFIKAYAGKVADRTNPDISPLFGNLNGLPPRPAGRRHLGHPA
jgi:acetyl esterase